MNSIDPRAYSKTKLVPPDPLPYVSRQHLLCVKNPLPIPTSCRYCNSPVKLTSNKEVYFTREYGSWPYVYLCTSCKAYVGLHPDTDIPLGTLADKATREARKQSKAVFHVMMNQLNWTRTKSYKWLAQAMGIEEGHCHFGWFEITECNKAIQVCQQKLQENPNE